MVLDPQESAGVLGRRQDQAMRSVAPLLEMSPPLPPHPGVCVTGGCAKSGTKNGKFWGFVDACLQELNAFGVDFVQLAVAFFFWLLHFGFEPVES